MRTDLRPHGDVAKCQGKRGDQVCPLRESCGRYLRPDHPIRQLYLQPTAIGDGCDQFEALREITE